MSSLADRRSILAVEDSDEDFEVLRLSLIAAGATNPLIRCAEAASALRLLDQQANENGGEKLPALVLLDLNLPDMDGRELLRRIRADPRLKTVPTIILSTSANPRDVLNCYKSFANGYLVKPVGLEKFERMVRTLVEFWLRTAYLPASILESGT